MKDKLPRCGYCTTVGLILIFVRSGDRFYPWVFSPLVVASDTVTKRHIPLLIACVSLNLPGRYWSVETRRSNETLLKLSICPRFTRSRDSSTCLIALLYFGVICVLIMQWRISACTGTGWYASSLFAYALVFFCDMASQSYICFNHLHVSGVI